MNKKLIFALLLSASLAASVACQSTNDKTQNEVSTEISTEKNSTETNIDDETTNEDTKTEVTYTVGEKELSAQIMTEFDKVKDTSIEKVANFIDENIDKVINTDADILILKFIELSEADAKIQNSNQVGTKLNSILGINYGPDAQKNGIEYGVPLLGDKKLLILNSLTDDAAKKEMSNIFAKGQTTDQYEGEYYLIVDFDDIYTKYGSNVTESLNLYLSIMSKETTKSLLNGEYLAVSLEELENRLVKYEKFLLNNDNEYSNNIKDLYSAGLWRVLSSFTYLDDQTEDFTLKGERLDYYIKLKDLEDSPVLAEAVTELYEFYNSDSNGLADSPETANDIIYNKSQEIHKNAMSKIK